jgi:hypothetical protein
MTMGHTPRFLRAMRPRACIYLEIIFRDSATLVIAGLDPAIHLLRQIRLKIDGCPGQARA